MASGPEWEEDSKRWCGRVLTGRYGHWCDDWDGLTIDETCEEWPCVCVSNLIDQLVEEWHTSDEAGVGLHEYLGMTIEQYNTWVETSKPPWEKTA